MMKSTAPRPGRIHVSCDCGAARCPGVVVEIAAIALDKAKTPKAKRTLIHNYVQRRDVLALMGTVRVVSA